MHCQRSQHEENVGPVLKKIASEEVGTVQLQFGGGWLRQRDQKGRVRNGRGLQFNSKAEGSRGWCLAALVQAIEPGEQFGYSAIELGGNVLVEVHLHEQ